MTHIPAHSHEQRGFTLVETLVAIAILMIALVGPYFSIQQAIVTSYAARDQLIASQLAQEGQEYIHFRRNTNYLQSASWTSGMSNCFSPYGCTVDPALNAISACSSPGCPALRLLPIGLYTQSTVGSFPLTRFTRTVTMQNLNSYEVQVTVTVNWITEHHPYSVTVVDDLYNWL